MFAFFPTSDFCFPMTLFENWESVAIFLPGHPALLLPFYIFEFSQLIYTGLLPPWHDLFLAELDFAWGQRRICLKINQMHGTSFLSRKIHQGPLSSLPLNCMGLWMELAFCRGQDQSALLQSEASIQFFVLFPPLRILNISISCSPKACTSLSCPFLL